MRIGNHDTHPAADLFPMLEGEAFEELCADIRTNGLIDPIWRIWVDCGADNGTRKPLILDGRNRLMACGRERVVPRFRDYEGDDPVGFVLSLNLRRRHLDESQRAMVAARVASMRQGARTDLGPKGPMSQSDAAAALNVGTRSVKRAKAVIEHGDAELVAAVDAGHVPVTAAAEIAEKPAEAQREIVQRIKREREERGSVSASAVLRDYEAEREPEPIFDDLPDDDDVPAPLTVIERIALLIAAWRSGADPIGTCDAIAEVLDEAGVPPAIASAFHPPIMSAPTSAREIR
jgi:hypothetical protein